MISFNTSPPSDKIGKVIMGFRENYLTALVKYASHVLSERHAVHRNSAVPRMENAREA